MAAVIRENSDPRGITVCGGDGRERNVFTSVSHVVEIRMLGQQSASEDGGYYLLKYEGTPLVPFMPLYKDMNSHNCKSCICLRSNGLQ